MSANILLTGASGYLGGDLLSQIPSANLPPYEHLYVLVRSDSQAENVNRFGAEPLFLDLSNEQDVAKAIVTRNINIIFFLIDAASPRFQPALIKALGEVKKKTGREVHFLHVSGAKMFSEHAGFPIDRPLLDTDPDMYDLITSLKAPHEAMEKGKLANITVTETGRQHGVRSYIFAPCIVYGKGRGFGNTISIQTRAIVRAAKKAKKVYDVNQGEPSWPVCHVSDNTALFVTILRAILEGKDVAHGPKGIFFATSGRVKWIEIYKGLAKDLAKRGIINDAEVGKANDAILTKMSDGLGVSKEFVAVSLAGCCTFEARHGQVLGWNPQFAPGHIVDTADEEVQIILDWLEKAEGASK